MIGWRWRVRHQRPGAGDPVSTAPHLGQGEPEPKPPVEYAEVPKPPLPATEAVRRLPRNKDDRAPKERIAGANAAARIDPVKDGYINAIQVYPTPRARFISSTPSTR